jgi:uncharacterized protein HemX
MSYLKIALAAVGVVVVSAAAIKAVKVYNEELSESKVKTKTTAEQAEQDIADAKAETEKVREECERKMKETAKNMAEDRRQHEMKMEELAKQAEEQARKTAIRKQALTDWEDSKLSTAELNKILMDTTL